MSSIGSMTNIVILKKQLRYQYEAAGLWPCKGYTDMTKGYENGLYGAEDDRTEFSPGSDEYIIECLNG